MSISETLVTRALWFSAVIAGGGAACDDAAAPTGTRLTVVAGGGQVGTVGQAVSVPYEVLVSDGSGASVPGVAVTWTILTGAGTFDATETTTNTQGRARATHHLGTVAGLQSVRVQVTGSPDAALTFTTTAYAAVPAVATKVSGDRQSGASGAVLPAPYVVRVTDQYGNPNFNITVEFTALSGSVFPATAQTNLSGIATAISVLSTNAGGPDSVLAVVPALGETLVFVSYAIATIPILTQVPVPPNYGLHDTYVRDGIAFACVWNEGVFIYDVGNGMAGGRPAAPVPIDTIRTVGGQAHNAWWFHNPVTMERRYLFVGQEGPGVIGASSSGDIHVIDVSDLHNPREVAFYRVTGAGAHNFWMDENAQVLYAAFYNGGVVALDVSGTLTGDLGAAGREIHRIQPGGATNTYVWGVQQHNGSIYAVDMLSGLWQLRHTGTTLSVAGGGNNVPERYGSDLWAYGDHVYTGTWSSRGGNLGNMVKIWRLNATGAPSLAGTVTVANVSTVSDVQVSADGRVLVFSAEGGAGAGLYVYGVDDPESPVPLARATGISLHTATVAEIGGRRYVFAAKNPGAPAMAVFDITAFAP